MKIFIYFLIKRVSPASILAHCHGRRYSHRSFWFRGNFSRQTSRWEMNPALWEELDSPKEHRKQRTFHLVGQQATRIDSSQRRDWTLDRHEKDTESGFQPAQNALWPRGCKIALDRKHQCGSVVATQQRAITFVDVWQLTLQHGL